VPIIVKVAAVSAAEIASCPAYLGGSIAAREDRSSATTTSDAVTLSAGTAGTTAATTCSFKRSSPTIAEQAATTAGGKVFVVNFMPMTVGIGERTITSGRLITVERAILDYKRAVLNVNRPARPEPAAAAADARPRP